MKKLARLLSFLFLLMGIGAAGNQVFAANWTIEENEDIVRSVVSPRGKFMVYIVEDDDYLMKCTNLDDGTNTWSRKFDNGAIDEAVFFISARDEVIFSTKDSLYFLDSKNGEVLQRLDMFPDNQRRYIRKITFQEDADFRWLGKQYHEDFHDASDINRMVDYYVDENLLIVYLDRRIHMFDLVDRRSIHYGKGEHIHPVVVELDPFLMIMGNENSKHMYILNRQKRELVYIHDNSDRPVPRFYREPFTVRDSLLVFLTYEGAEILNLNSGKIIKQLEFDLEDSEMVRLFHSDDDLLIVQSHDEEQSVYSVIKQRKLWQRGDDVLAGIVDTVVFVDKNDAICCLHSRDQAPMVSLARVNMLSGDVRWKTALATARLPFFSDYSAYAPQWACDVEYRTYNGTPSWKMNYCLDSARNIRDHGATFMRLMDVNNGFIHGSLIGYLSQSGDFSVEEIDTDGELFFSVDLATGELIERYRPQIMSRIDPYEDVMRSTVAGPYNYYIPNAGNKFSLFEIDGTNLGVGFEHVFLFHPDGTIDSLKLADTQDQDGLHVVTSRRENGGIVVRSRYTSWYDYWDVNVANGAIQTTLLVRSMQPNVRVSDSADLSHTYYIAHGNVQAYPRMQNPDNWVDLGQELWSVPIDEYDGLLKGWSAVSRYRHNFNMGVRITTDGDLIMNGTKGLLVITSDGKLTTSTTLNFEEALKTRLSPTQAGRSVAFQCYDRIYVVNLDGGESPIVEYTVPEFDKALPIVTSERGKLVIVDKEDNRILCHDMLE